MNKGSFISRDESIMLQGIAVCLMVVHHLIGFPERIGLEYYNVFDFDFFHFETMLGYFGRICIVIFAFNSGYGIMKKMNDSYDRGSAILKKGYSIAVHQLKKFYMIYWTVFVVFIPYGIIKHIYTFQLIPFVKSFLGLTSVYNAEWWYVSVYLKMMLIFPIAYLIGWYINRVLKKLGIVLVMAVGLILCLLGVNSPFHSFMCMFYCFALGAFFVYFSLFEKIYEWIKMHRVWGVFLGTLMFGVCVFIRVFVTQSIDYLIAPVLVFGFVVFLKSIARLRYVHIILFKIGKYSTYIWLTHTFFAYYYWQRYLYALKYSVLIVAICIVCCVLVGIILESLLQGLLHSLERRRM